MLGHVGDQGLARLPGTRCSRAGPPPAERRVTNAAPGSVSTGSSGPLRVVDARAAGHRPARRRWSTAPAPAATPATPAGSGRPRRPRVRVPVRAPARWASGIGPRASTGPRAVGCPVPGPIPPSRADLAPTPRAPRTLRSRRRGPGRLRCPRSCARPGVWTDHCFCRGRGQKPAQRIAPAGVLGADRSGPAVHDRVDGAGVAGDGGLVVEVVRQVGGHDHQGPGQADAQGDIAAAISSGSSAPTIRGTSCQPLSQHALQERDLDLQAVLRRMRVVGGHHASKSAAPRARRRRPGRARRRPGGCARPPALLSPIPLTARSARDRAGRRAPTADGSIDA